MGGKARGGFLLGKRKGVIQIQAVPRHPFFIKEMARRKSICACPKPTHARTIIPAVLGKIIKRRGWLPFIHSTNARFLVRKPLDDVDTTNG